MRFAFIDEAGLSNRTDEPFVVAAGIILDADRQWRLLQDYLYQIEGNDPPPEHKGRAFFHAHALYSGRTPFEDINGWNKERRLRVLESIVSIPKYFRTPVVWGIVDRSQIEQGPLMEGCKDHAHMAHVVALTHALVQVERAMRIYPTHEVAKVVIEDSPHVREQMRKVSRFISDPRNFLGKETAEFFPMNRIVGSPQFEEKADEILLQIADACAYVIKRKCMGDRYIGRFFQHVLDGAIFYNETDKMHPMFKK